MTSHNRLSIFLGMAILAALGITTVVLMTGGLTATDRVAAPTAPAAAQRTPSAPNASPNTSRIPLPVRTPGPGPALGAFIPAAPSDPSLIDEFAELVGTDPAIVMWYQPWSAGGTFYREVADAVRQRGAMPLVTWEPWDGKPDDPAWSLRTIIDGEHDPYIRRWVRDVAAWGQPIYVRIMHEMNGTWSAWSPNVNGNTTDEFVPAWRHIVDLARAEGATNIRWVWCPNIDTGNPRYAPYADVYPGDDYVDWAGLDGFNWGTSQGADGDWKDIRPLFAPSIDQLRSVTSKPLMIVETASAEEGGDKAEWIRDGFGRIPELLPEVRAVLWFNRYEARTDVDWSIDSSPEALRAFRDVVASGVFGGVLP